MKPRAKDKILAALGAETMTTRRVAYLSDTDETTVRDLVREGVLKVVGTWRDPLAPRVSKPLKLVKVQAVAGK